ncbi:hypothetical protein GALMADRAFT_153978 [Galerina marginata CBS 339.88]|uniref:Uncharacterized protein n=1 Tax=Galerina marginata (strain CBS 339.88) TaxID=685588 RepID=A0A067TN10_GALM3|nr:hypothetical protein GALMADRAFT_153978 [Galerina marginata CBS 339.88]
MMYQSTHSMSTQFRDSAVTNKYCTPQLAQRIFSWRTSIPSGPSDVLQNPTASTSGTKPRTRQKPYTRPDQPIRSQPTSSADVYNGDTFESSNLYQESKMHPTILKENVRGTQDNQAPRFVIPRSSNDLPDRDRNPLITDFPGDIEEEYYRVILLHNQLWNKKRKVELRYLVQPSLEVMQQLMDAGASIQRVLQCARYIEAYSKSRGFNIDFDALCSQNQYCEPPPKQQMYESLEGTIKMPQARAFGEGWKVNPL